MHPLKKTIERMADEQKSQTQHLIDIKAILLDIRKMLEKLAEEEDE
jgi:hypothetical protein